MAIPLTILEEHHEAYIVWRRVQGSHILDRGNNLLIHVDEHADLGLPICKSDLRSIKAELNALREFTYSELTIESFVYAAVYAGIFSELVWVQHGPSTKRRLMHLYSVGGEGKTLRLTGDVYRAGVFNTDRKQVFLRRQTVAENLPAATAVALDIDLDYFSCNSALQNYGVEVTINEYQRFVNDRYHPIRLHSGHRVVAKEQNGRFYLLANDVDADEQYGGRQSDAEICERISRLISALAEARVVPRLITVCRSCRSGYTPADQLGFIESELVRQLSSLYDLDIHHIDAL